jgi:hypothetical protein
MGWLLDCLGGDAEISALIGGDAEISALRGRAFDDWYEDVTPGIRAIYRRHIPAATVEAAVLRAIGDGPQANKAPEAS